MLYSDPGFTAEKLIFGAASGNSKDTSPADLAITDEYGVCLLYTSLGMLNSCSPNVTVVNIDNGFGAAYTAVLIARAAARRA